MATITGKDGSIAIGGNAIASVRDWSLETSAGTAESSTMGSDWQTHLSTLKGFTASVNCYLDAADTTGQGAMVEGATVSFALYPAGNTSSNEEYTGSLIITGVSKSGSYDGMVEVSFSGTGTGALTIGTVV